MGEERREQGRGRDDARKVDWGQRRKNLRLFLGWGMHQRTPRVCLNPSDDSMGQQPQPGGALVFEVGGGTR